MGDGVIREFSISTLFAQKPNNLFTYQDTFYEPGTTAGNAYQAGMNGIAGGPALRNIPVIQLPVKFGTNGYTQQERNDSWATLKAYMFSRESRNLYYHGHGSANTIGADLDTYGTNGVVTGGRTLPFSKAYLSSKTVRDDITYNKYGGARPYRFVWLDGCSTANGDWPGAFGVNKATNALGYYTSSVTNPSHKRPSAFVGWNQVVGGPGWGTVQNEMNCLTQWMFDWQQNWQVKSLTDSLTFGRQSSNWVPNEKFWGALRVYGYTVLKMNEYNQKNDWPGP